MTVSIGVRATREYLHLDDASKLGSNAIDYAAVNTPQGAKLQAAVNLAAQGSSQGYADSTVFVAGSINCNDISELLIPLTGTVRILGAGSGDDRAHSSACLRWTVDSGAGKRYINPGLTPYPYRVEKLTIAGPYSDSPISAGSEPVQAVGLYLDTRGHIDDVRVIGCNAGAELINDHQGLGFCDFRGNVYGLKYGPNATGGLGDEYVLRTYLTDQSRASIAVCDSATIGFLRIVQGHIGSCPIGIWRYPHFFAATGSGASATITAVNVTQFVPAAGMIVAGPNIPNGTLVAPGGVAGTPGNYSLTLTNTPTGTVSKAMVGSRGTFLSSLQLDSQSIEGADIEIYDEVYDVWGVQGGVGDIALNAPGESSTFASTRHWRQTAVAATGSNGNNVLTGVALTQFAPMEGMEVTGTNVPAGARIAIGGIAGTSGNYTLTLTLPASGTVTAVTVSKPSVGVAAIDAYSVRGMVWRDGGSTTQAGHPLINAVSIADIQIDDPIPILNLFTDNAGLGTARPFKIKGAYNANGTELKNVRIGRGDASTGATLLGAGIVNEAVQRGDLLERTAFQHVQKWRTGKPLGVALDDFSQGEAAVWCHSALNVSSVQVRNRSGGSITAGALLKPDGTNPGGVVAATGITDGPIVGRLQNGGPLAAGATGQADIFI